MIKLSLRVWVLIIALFLALLMISPSFESGALIKSVEKNSTAFENGMRAGMKIKEINSQIITDADSYGKAITDAFNGINASRIDIKTDKEDFIFLANNLSEITVGDIPNTKIKTGLDLSGGARALVKPVDVVLSEEEIADLVSVTSQRLNAFGLTDVSVRSVSDLEGNNFMLIEIAGATPADIKDLVGKQGKFEAKVGNQTAFIGGQQNDISNVCRNDATCALITGCEEIQDGDYICHFRFGVTLTAEAAKKHADITREIPLDDTGQYLAEKLYLFVDEQEVDSLFIGANLRGQETTEISIQGSGQGKTQQEAYDDTKNSMNKLQTILLTGSLPYKLEIVKLDTISPFLGEQFARSIVFLGLVVFIIVSAILFVRYRRIKITLAVILTMFSEMFITLGIAALIRWNLDAPSIAGIIAGMGTGLNDQIVIIDEAESGKETSGLKERIKRALFIIVGAFLTIVAAMLPLFWAGAGMLRGFAFTTIIGISVGILITRPAFADIMKKIEG